jgi:hypothetical protein
MEQPETGFLPNKAFKKTGEDDLFMKIRTKDIARALHRTIAPGLLRANSD